MKISFVIPAYNEEKYLGACLESVMAEIKRSEGLNAEIIVVNNASTDNTKNVALKYPGVKVVDEPKKGLVMARALGASVASGELLAHIDADCRLPKGWATKVLKEFSLNKNLVALSGPYVYYDFNFWQNLLVSIYYDLAFLLYLFIRYIIKKASMLQGGNIIVKKTAWEKIGKASPDFKFYGEDTDLAVRLHKIGKVKFTLGLKNSTSGRRLLTEGILTTAYHYIINYLSVIFFEKPFSKQSTDIRA